ncbi:MAG TPA: hypothetical protein PK926_06550 [Spirochaetota bacterium]|nr:hypothetical protein [Spirochaetota bacterium]HPI91376.1 hypothetical protein [Spirochaetota bacterium]
MKFKIIFFLIVLFSFSCKNSSESFAQSAYMKKYNKMNTEEKIEYINGLKGDKIGEFFREFLPEAVFIYPPNEGLKFYKDGEIIIRSVGHTPKEVLMAYWKVEDNVLNIWKKNKFVPFPDRIHEKLVLDKAEKGSDHNRIIFKFTDVESGSRDMLIYEKHGEAGPEAWYYEKYVKKKK